MERFKSLFGEVELTEERERHILEHHPEIRAYRKYFVATLIEPEFIRRSKYDAKTLIFYKLLKKHYLAIVIKTNQRNFIITAYITSKTKH